MSLKLGELNNYEKCGSSYGEYGKKNSKEYWCVLPVYIKKNGKKIKQAPKGLCQFCNNKSEYNLNEF